jgi:protein-disulfide isomerase
MSENNKPTDKLLPGLMIVVVIMAFVMGVMWNKLQDLEKGGVQVAADQTTTGTQQPAGVSVDINKVKSLFEDSNLIVSGKKDSKLLFVEVADPSCPYCHIAAGLNPSLNKQVGGQFIMVADGGTYVAPVLEMKKLVDQGKAALVYIYSPGHGNGELGTKAMFCAEEKGKFWDVHDLLYTDKGYSLLNDTVKNDKANSGQLAQFLSSAVDSSFMQSCLESGKYDERLTKNVEVARSLGVGGTPGFFVNETFFEGAYSFNDMKSAVEAAL